MKLLGKAEKSKISWFLIIISFIFFLLRLPSLGEPNWYADEGIYQTIGMAMNNGSHLYTDIWDNKPPLLYIMYAIFNGDQFSVRFVSLIFGLFSTLVFFALGQKLFENTKATIIATILYCILFATPLIEGNIANAENFMLLPILIAAFLVYQITNKQTHSPFAIRHKLFTAGLFLGIAFLFKIVAIFDLAAFLTFIFVINTPFHLLNKKLKIEKNKLVHLLHNTSYIILGFLVPVFITSFYFVLTGSFGDFIHATFFGNIGYVGWGNKFIVPQGFLILKLLILSAFIFLVFSLRYKFSKSSIFVLIWLAFSLFNALFSQRPYMHYVLVLLPSFCLLIAFLIQEKNLRVKRFSILVLILIFVSLLTTFRPLKFSDVKRVFFYYNNFISFIIGKKDLHSYQAFFDSRTPRDYQIASFIKMNTKKHERIFIWGDSAQIYVLSQTLPINKYTVAYHILQSKESIRRTQMDISIIKPKYIIALPESKNIPFTITGYDGKFSLTDASIYERSF